MASRLCAVVALAALLPAISSAQLPRRSIITGTVLGQSTQPLVGVRVHGVLAGVIRSEALTDSTGAFRLAWWTDSVPMTVVFRRIGLSPLRRSVAVWSEVSSPLRIVMEDRAAILEQSIVRAKPSRPVQDLSMTTLTPGATARTLDASTGLSGDLSGDLGAALAWLPGVFMPPGGGLKDASVFGLNGADNARTVNGQSNLGGALPRDGLTHSLRLSTYDPRVGRFAGAVLTSVLQSGNFIQRAAGRVTVQPAAVGLVGGAGGLGAQLPTNVIASGTLSGPLAADQMFYSASAQVRNVTTNVPTLGLNDAPGVVIPGLQDSLAALRVAAQSLGLLPSSIGAMRIPQSTTSASAIARLDLTPNAQPSGDAQATILYLLFTGALDQQRNQGVGRTSTRDAATRSDRHDGSVQVVWAPFLRSALLEVRSKVGVGTERTRPESLRPKAVVSPFAINGDIGLVAALGGAATPALRDAYLAWETGADVAWRNTSGSHAFNAFAQLDLYSRSLSGTTARTGVYGFQSLDAFRRNAPASFVRTPAIPSVTARSSHVAVGLSDTWTANLASRDPFAVRAGGLMVQYGVRAEADVVALPSDSVSSVASASGAGAFTRIAVLPMIGATWRLTEVTRRVGGFTTSFFRHEFQAGARRYRGGLGVVGASSLPLAVGLGRFRGSEECVGDAILTPTWGIVDAAVDACRDVGGAPAVLRTMSRTALAPGWRPPESARAEFRWSRRQSPGLLTDVTWTAASNTRQADVVDRNLRPDPLGVDVSEGSRARFFNPAAVDVRTGAVSIAASRRDAQLGRLVELASTAESRVMQVTTGVTWRPGATGTARLDPVRAINGQLRAAYTGTAGSQSGNAYTLGAASVADARVRGRLTTPAHAFLFSTRLTVDSWFSVQAGVRVASGIRFTPVYSMDVNGDGVANDRIYMPDGAQREALLHALPTVARTCLNRTRAQFAAVNGCDAPWSTTLSPILIELDARRFRLGSRGAVTLAISNPLTGLDRLVHGDRASGWGTLLPVDPALLTVTGFDAATQRFQYIAATGATAARQARTLFQPPLTVSLDVRLDVGRNLETQRIETFIKRGDAGAPLPPSQFRDGLLRDAAAFTAEDIGFIVQNFDSLQCDSSQRARLLDLRQRRTAERTALLSRLADQLAVNLDNLKSRELRQIWHATMIASLESSERISAEALQILTPEQTSWLLRRDLLPSFTRPRGWLDRERRTPQVMVR
jgi:hypothetical protein